MRPEPTARQATERGQWGPGKYLGWVVGLGSVGPGQSGTELTELQDFDVVHCCAAEVEGTR